MHLTILELPARWGDPVSVLGEVDAALRVDAATDLVLLPEAALHGYVSPDGDCDLAPFAETIDGPTATACGALAARHGVHVVAPLVLREGTALFNAMACFDPRGGLSFVYRKRHPWFPETWATPGAQAPPLVELCGVGVTIAICFDLHFLADEAARELAAADLLLFPSAWVEEPDLRLPRLAALASEFDLIIANANWAAGDVQLPGQAGSCIVGRNGDVLARAVAGRLDYDLAP
jgi:predicted amidohydrolase